MIKLVVVFMIAWALFLGVVWGLRVAKLIDYITVGKIVLYGGLSAFLATCALFVIVQLF